LKITCPRIVIAGAHSGVGKTSLTLALVSALSRRGLRVQTFKVGPDFLDPSYLSLAAARPCYNLDGWMAGRDYVGRLFARLSQDADIAVIEGVMGLFDGAQAASSAGSTAEIARWLKAPVLLIVDAHGMARSLAAVVKGFAAFERGVQVAGVIANRTGTERHGTLLAEVLQAASLPPLVGAAPLGALPHLASRHLGLVTADGQNLPAASRDELAAAGARYVSLEEVLKIAGTAAPLTIRLAGGLTGSRAGDTAGRSAQDGRQEEMLSLAAPEARPATRANRSGRDGQAQEMPAAANTPAGGITIGVAFDRAFHFYYRDLFDELARRGAALTFFSPLADRRLPAGLDALYIGGGYPEEHAETLAANGEMLAGIRDFAASGRPVYAECGGLMYLCRSLTTREGVQYPMAGLIPAATRTLDKIKSLAYVEATLNADSLWGARGEKLRGHEFHYSELTSDPTADGEWRPVYDLQRSRSGEIIREGFQRGRILASYTHLHLASRPEALAYFLENCRQGKGRP